MWCIWWSFNTPWQHISLFKTQLWNGYISFICQTTLIWTLTSLLHGLEGLHEVQTVTELPPLKSQDISKKVCVGMGVGVGDLMYRLRQVFFHGLVKQADANSAHLLCSLYHFITIFSAVSHTLFYECAFVVISLWKHISKPLTIGRSQNLNTGWEKQR